MEYKIIIPSEELKSFSDFSDKFFGSIPKEEPKQETLEEAAKKYFNNFDKRKEEFAFIDGAKWQAERSYTEEELHKIIESYQNVMENNPIHTHYNKWFEQFKKK